MARRRSRKSRNSNIHAQRDVPSIARGFNPLLDLSPIPRSGRLLKLIEDRRTYHPSGPVRPARSPRRWNHVLQERPSRRSSRSRPMLGQISFRGPESILVCVRRQRRREVIFAKSLRGKGSRSRTRKRSYYSQIGC